MAQSRIAESYVQIVPVIEGITDILADQIDDGFIEAGKRANKKAEESVQEPAKKSGGAWAATFATAVLASGALASIGAKATEIISDSIDTKKTNNKVAAALTLTEAQRSEIEAASSNLFYAAYGESYEEVSETMKAIVGSVKGAKDASFVELEEMGRDVLNLSSTWDVGAEEIAQASQVMIGTGLAKDFGEATSIITGGFQELGEAGGDWIDTLIEFSDDFQRFGLSGQEAVNLISRAVDAGLKDTDKFADALNEMSITLMEGDEKTDEVIKSIGIDPVKMRENIKAGGDAAQAELINVLTKLQNSGDVGNFQKLMSSIGEDFQTIFMNMDLTNLSSQFQGVTGDMAVLDETLREGGVTTLDEMSRAIERLFGEIFIPLFNEALPYLLQFTEFLQGNEHAVTILAAVIGGVVVLALVAATIAMWNFAAAAIAAAIPVLAVSWPVLLVVAAIAALIAIIWLLWDNWDSIMSWLSDTMTAAADWINGAIESIKEAWNDLMEFLRGGVDAIGGFFGGIFGGIGDVFSLNASVNYTTDTSGLPQMAMGGVVKARPGGTAVVLGEAGRDEAVVDAGKLNQLINGIVDGGVGSEGNAKSGNTYNIYQAPGMTPEQIVQAINQYEDMTEIR